MIDLEPKIIGWVKGTSCFYPITQNGPEGKPYCVCKGYEYRKKCRHLDMFQSGVFLEDVQYKLWIESKDQDGLREFEIIGDNCPNQISIEEISQLKETLRKLGFDATVIPY